MNRLYFAVILFLGGAFFSCADHDSMNNDPLIELKAISFEAIYNSQLLTEDVKCEVIGDTLIECWIPSLLNSKLLRPTIVYSAESCTIDSLPYQRGESLVDFRRPIRLRLTSNGTNKDYLMLVHTFTGLPVVRIDTKCNEEILSKEEYVEANISVSEDIIHEEAKGLEKFSVLIKGRGHSTWTLFPKKPYRLKFDEKVGFLDMPKDKSWVLLANYKDNTLLRNHIAYWLGSISGLEYTPRFQFVELVLNGKYNGTYQLGEKLKISKQRLSIGDDGFLLEMASNEDNSSPHFTTNQLDVPFYFKDPDVVYDDLNYCYARDYLIEAESALYTESFTDSLKGWRNFFDEDSFADYYIINEIAKNVDAVRWTSTYINFSKGGKVKMGPIWDFDSAFGNETHDGCDKPEGFYTKRFGWYPQLFKDSSFVATVKNRFDFFYSKRNDLMEDIDRNAEILYRSAYQDNAVWHNLDEDKRDQHDHRHYQGGGYYKEVEWLKEWICKRLDWLKIEYDNLYF